MRNSESTPSEPLLRHEGWPGHSAIRFYCTIRPAQWKGDSQRGYLDLAVQVGHLPAFFAVA
eukprot:4208495-Alexandrium_andersonii.AAC.1